MKKMSYRHWIYKRDEAGIAWITFDFKDAPVNRLSSEALQELLSLLQSLAQGDPLPIGLIIQSDKKSGFIAGADIQQFKNLETSDAALQLIQQGQRVFNELAKLPFPTVALIRGFCLGGGVELALACRYRVAIIDPKTKIGLPEVMLGIHPGWGGTIRLPQLVGGLNAMDLILSGRSLDAKEAQKMGLVDAAVELRQGLVAARYFIKNHPPCHKASLLQKMTNLGMIRRLLGKWLYKKVNQKVNPGHYPAPFAALEHWVKTGCDSDAGFMDEAQSISRLMLTDTARNLLRVFYLQEKLKGLGLEFSFRPDHIHVIGAGVMGGDIAAWCALKGFKVTLQDQNEVAIANTLSRALTLFKKQLKETHLVKSAMDRLIPDIEGAGIKKANLIIEAIIEKVDAKKSLFLQLEKEARRDAILVTNTSTIPLTELSDSGAIRKRLIGLHFFNPVAKMPLVEVIALEETDPLVVKNGMAFIHAIGKLPLPVKSAPGFLVNRILMPYLLEGILLLESGVPPQMIDKAAVAFGMPMGPIELADTVGLDVCLYAGESLIHYFGGSIPDILQKRVAAKQLGKKTGQGFYQYKKGKAVQKQQYAHYQLPEDLIDRLIGRLLNAAVACLREKIVANADYLDAGMIFGAGFPPFRGGPMHYVASQGEALMVQRLNLLTQRYGERFLPDPGWNTIKF